jgi:hypothetical protein
MPTLNPGDSIQAATTANPAGTTFTLNPGVYTLAASITPKSGNNYLGVSGAILDGTGWVSTDLSQGAFRAHNQDINTVTISNLEIRNMPQKGVYTFKDFCDGWVVSNCYIHHCRVGVHTSNTMLIDTCHLAYCLGDETSTNPNLRGGGYHGYKPATVTIQNCEIDHNGAEQKIFQGTNVSFLGNYAHHGKNGLWADNCIGALWDGNTVTDFTEPGIFPEVTKTFTVRNNTVRRCGTGIFCSGSRDGEVYSNGVFDCFRAIQYYFDLIRVGESGSIFPLDLIDITSHDNSITIPTTAGAYGCTLFLGNATAAQITTYQTSKNLHFETNTYRVPSLTGSYWIWGNV